MSMPDLVIRDAVPAEWEAVADLHARSWASAYRGMMSDAYLDGPVRDERRAIWRERFASPPDSDRIVVVAAECDRLVGLACILAGYDPEWGALIDNLHVDPDRKRRGIGGRILLAAADRMAAGHRARPIHLTVLEANAAAQAAYERWGGRLAERLTKREPDGQEHPIRLYAWDTPGELAARLRTEGPGGS